MTDNQRKKVKFISRDEFRTRELVVEPGILGLFHEFSYDRSIVRVEIPPLDYLNKKHGLYDLWLYVCQTRGSDSDSGERIPTGVGVRYVFVYVSRDEMFPVPTQALEVQPNASELFPENHRKSLEGLAESYGKTAREAFNLWLRTLRWKCMKGYIAQPEIHGIETGGSTYLLTADTKKRFWAGSVSLIGRFPDPITLEEWESVERSLENGEKPPVYYDLLFDAREHFKIRDYARTVVDAAIACESYLRMVVSQTLPEELNAAFKKAFKKYAEKASISPVLYDLFPEILTEDERKCFDKIKSTLNDLFDARNKIVHLAHFEGLTEQQRRKCKQYLDATYNLLTLK